MARLRPIRIRVAAAINILERITAVKTKAAKRAANKSKEARASKLREAVKLAAVSKLQGVAAEDIPAKK